MPYPVHAGHPGYPILVIQSVLQGRVYHRFGIFISIKCIGAGGSMTKYGFAKDCVKNPADQPMWCGLWEWGLSSTLQWNIVTHFNQWIPVLEYSALKWGMSLINWCALSHTINQYWMSQLAHK